MKSDLRSLVTRRSARGQSIFAIKPASSPNGSPDLGSATFYTFLRLLSLDVEAVV